MDTERPPSTRRTQFGIFLVLSSLICWALVFTVPFLVEHNAAWIAGGLYGLSYVLWFAAIPVLGRSWFIEQKGYWMHKIRTRWRPF